MLVSKKLACTFDNPQKAWRRLLWINYAMLPFSLFVCIYWTIHWNHDSSWAETASTVGQPLQIALWGTIEFVLSGTGAMNVTGIAIDLWRNGAGAPDGMAWEVSVDGGAFIQFGGVNVESNAGDGVFRTQTFTGDINANESVVFRFAPQQVIEGTGGNIHISGLTVEGTFTPIPEPSSMFLAGFGVFFFALKRRRK